MKAKRPRLSKLQYWFTWRVRERERLKKVISIDVARIKRIARGAINESVASSAGST